MVIAVCLLCSIGGTAAAQNAPPARVPRVAVVVTLLVNVEPAQGDQIGEALAVALTKKLVVDAIGGAEVTRRMPTAGLDEECPGKPECVADVASRTQADQILFLAIQRIGTDHQIDATWVDVASNKRVSRPAVPMADIRNANSVFEANAGRYLPDAESRDKGPNIIYNNGNKEPTRPLRPVVLIVGGGGLVAVIASGVLGLSVRSKYDACKTTACTQSEKDAIDSRALIADVMLGVGIAAVSTAAILYFTTPKESPTEPMPAVTPVAGGAVFGVEGRW
jgi:hypothetical protein